MKHATIINAPESIQKIQDYPDGFDPANVAHKFGPDKEKRIVPVVELKAETPTKNQKLVKVGPLVEATQVTYQKVAQDLTADEIKQNDSVAEGEKQRAYMSALFASMKAGTPPTAEEQRQISLFLLSQLGVTE